MTKPAGKIDESADAPVAKPQRAPIDVEAGYKRALARFPKIIARLAR